MKSMQREIFTWKNQDWFFDSSIIDRWAMGVGMDESPEEELIDLLSCHRSVAWINNRWLWRFYCHGKNETKHRCWLQLRRMMDRLLGVLYLQTLLMTELGNNYFVQGKRPLRPPVHTKVALSGVKSYHTNFFPSPQSDQPWLRQPRRTPSLLSFQNLMLWQVMFSVIRFVLWKPCLENIPQ